MNAKVITKEQIEALQRYAPCQDAKTYVYELCDCEHGKAVLLDDLLALYDNAPNINSEPFGYFKAEPFGWTDCAETDEGAIALYEHPQPKVGEPVWILSRDNKGRTTNIISGFPTKFDISNLPDGTELYITPQPDLTAKVAELEAKLLQE